MKRLWIAGWAISPAWFAEQARAAWPGEEHTAVSPSEAAAALAKGGYDALGGYSLGALWLMRHTHLIPEKMPITLLAPIFAFTTESARGGRVGKAVLAIQRKRMQTDAPAAVKDFFARAGLGEEGLTPALDALTSARVAELLQELDWLRDWSAEPPFRENWHGIVGDADALLDAYALKEVWPELRIISDLGHAPAPLLREAAKVETATKIIRSFDAAAENYDAHSGPQSSLAQATAELINAREREGQAIEFGAGTGLFTRRMQPWNGTYLATDAAPRMVAVGQRRCPSVQWQQRDATDATGLAHFRWIFACNLLQWLDAPDTVLRNWKNMMLPEGHMVAAILLPETLHELRAVMPEAQTLRWRTIQQWRDLLAGTGFAIEREQIWEHTSVHPTALALLGDLRAMGLAPWRTVGAGKLRAALRAYDEQFAQNGGVRATWRALLARARAAS